MNHICTEECTKIHPVEVDRNEHGDLYIEQRYNLIDMELARISDHSRIIVSKEDVQKFLEYCIEVMGMEWMYSLRPGGD